MSQLLKIILISLFVLTAMPQGTMAQSLSEKINFSGGASIVSQYVFRGITQSDEELALQASVQADHDSGLYAGLWGSSIDFNDNDEAHLEVDLYAGYQTNFEGLNVDIGAIYYAYPGADSALNYDFFELSGSMGKDFERFSLLAGLNYSPEYFGESGDALYSTLIIKAPVTDNVKFDAKIGYQTIDDHAAFGVPDYMRWGAGLTYSRKDFDFSATYSDTDLSKSDCKDGCSEKVIFGITKNF